MRFGSKCQSAMLMVCWMDVQWMFSGCSISINDFSFLILSLDKFSFNLGIIFVTNLVTFCTFLFFFDKKFCCLCNWHYGFCASTLLISNWIIIICWTRISVVGTLNRLRADRFVVRIPAGAKRFSVLKDVGPSPGPTQARIHWTTGLLRSKSQGLEADHSRLSSAEQPYLHSPYTLSWLV